jgi:hypothetical protein
VQQKPPPHTPLAHPAFDAQAVPAGATHLLSMQLQPVWHALVHEPQWLTSDVVSTHPLPHAANGEWHVNPHALEAHVATPFVTGGHACSHDPQWFGSV